MRNFGTRREIHEKFISGLLGLSYLHAALVLRGNEFPPVRDR